tara:strand:- start:521 stop:994 length:474 start_codon:yes stop_codon:yes gene_type:complete
MRKRINPYKPRTGPTNPPKKKPPKTTGPASKPKKTQYTTSFHKSKAAAEKDKGKPNTPGEKMREFKGKVLMGQIRNKKTFAGETGLEGKKKKLLYQRRGKSSGGSVAKDTHVTKEGKTAKKGLWYNIHQKRKRGETMRKKGAKGAPTAKAIRKSQSK